MAFLPDPIAAFAEQFGLAPKKKAKLTPDLAFGAEAVARAKNIQREMEKAKLLQEMSMKGAGEGRMVSGHYVAPSITQQLAGLAQGFIGNRQEQQAGEDQAQIAAAQQEQEANAMREMFAPKTPGGPMQPPSFDEADAAQFAPGGGAATSMLPVAADPQTVAERAAKFQGTKVASQVQDAMLKKQVAKMFPDDKPIQVEGGVYVPGNGFQISPETTAAREAESALKRDTLEQRIKENEDRLKDRALDRTSREAIATSNNEMKRELKSLGGALGRDRFVSTGQVDEQGRPIMVSSSDPRNVQVVGGGPPAGTAQPKTTFEKSVTAQTANREARGITKSLLDVPEATMREAFSVGQRLASKLPNVIGSEVQAETLSPAAAEFKANAMRESARQTHELYGAALTSGESERAKTFIVQPDDNWKTVQRKMRGIAQLQDEVHARLGRGSATDTVSQKRTAPVAAPAAPAGGGGWGKAEKQG